MENIRKGFKLTNGFESSSPSIMVMELDFVEEEEQQQPQLLKLENNLQESHDSMGMELHFLSEAQEKILKVPQALQLDEVMNNDNYFRQNMHIMDDQQQSNASYDPILTHISNSDYYFDDQMEQPDSSEELFPSLWSW